jgi:hypothetical protein
VNRDHFFDNDAMEDLMKAYAAEESAIARRQDRVESMLVRLNWANRPDLIQRLKSLRLDKWADAVLDAIELQIPKA